jgi:hypothetical protein
MDVIRRRATDDQLAGDFGVAAGAAGVEEVEVVALLLSEAGAFVSDFVTDFVSDFPSDLLSGAGELDFEA